MTGDVNKTDNKTLQNPFSVFLVYIRLLKPEHYFHLGMPAENSIELFNCSLCSYCETSLDGLASHIRKHIKPEPYSTAPPKETPLHVNTHEINDENKTTHNGGTQSSDVSTDANDFSPRIEVLNPRSVALNGTHNVIPNDSQRLLTSNFKENMPPVSYSRNIAPSSQQPQPMMQQEMRLENQPIPQRYVQLNSRDPQQYIDINTSHHPYSNQYVTNIHGKPTIIHTELPKSHHRNHQGSDRERVPRNIAPAPPAMPSPTNRMSNNEHRSRSNHSYENGHQTNGHRSYSSSMDNGYRSNTQNYHSVKTQRQSHTAVSPLASQYNTSGHLSPQGSKPDERLKQYHTNRLSDIQLNSIPKQNSQGNMSVPNNGALFLNPEQLMLGNVSSNILEQLAGLLVIPLKKTREASCQTDSVYNGGNYSNKQEQSTTRSMQTDLHMGQVAENYSISSPTLFGSFRSTDDLYECLVCGDEFASDYHLQEHTSTVHIYVCEKCYHSSRNVYEHNMHLSECGNRDTEMVCMECNSLFSSLKKLNLHRSKAHQIRMPFRCGVCSVPFETHEAVMQHISSHDSEVPAFKCRYCAKVFQSADGLSKHFSRHEGVDVLYECRFCKKSFSTNALLTDHISYVHVIREPNPSNEAMFAFGSSGKNKKDGSKMSSANNKWGKNTVKKYPLCRHCDLAFKNSELLHQHSEKCSKNTDAKVTPFICDVCKEYYPSDLERKQHLKKDHKRDSGFRCPKCSKIYRTWSRLKFHTKQQHLKKTCSDCSMIFTKEHVLRKHQEEKHGKPQGQPGDRVYTCSLCHTMLNTLTELMNHRKDVHPELSEMRTADQSSNATMLSYIDNINDDDVIVDCNVENGGNSYSNNLNQNDGDSSDSRKIYPSRGVAIKRSPSSDDISTKNDVGNNPSLKCHECGLLFEDEKRLKNHKGLIHGEMPFKCDLCPKSFQYSSQVVWHMRTHKSEANKVTGKVSSKLWKAKNKKFPSTVKLNKSMFICQFCGAKFSQEKLLKNHKGSVHKIKLFHCDICEYKCGHSTELIWHERTCRAKFKRKYPDSEYPSKEMKVARMDNGEMSDDEPPGGYVCHICDISFAMFEGYQSHMETHPDEEVPTPDNLCLEIAENSTVNGSTETSVKSPTPKMTLAELLSIDPEFDQSTGEYVCPVCHKTTRSMTGMKTHYGRVHGVWSESTSHIDKDKPKVVDETAVWPCKSCDRRFSSLGSLRHHTTVIHGYSVNKDGIDITPQKGGSPVKPQSTPQQPERNFIFSCPYCEVTFTKSKSIRVHAFKKHGTVLTDQIVKELTKELPPGETPAPTNQVLDNIRFKCFKCKSKFRSTKALRVHSIKRHNLVLSKKELQRTKIRIKPSEAVPQPVLTSTVNGDVFPCDFCGRVFTNHRAYFTHYRQAHRDASDQNASPKKPSKNEIVNYNSNTTPPDTNSTDIAAGSTSSSTTTSKANVKKEEKSPIQRVQCPKCEQSFAQVKGLYTHLYAAHHITKDQYPSIFPDGKPTLPTKKAVCTLCDKVCMDGRAMRIHVFKAHGLLYKDILKDTAENSSDVDFSDTITGKGELPEGSLHDIDENELRVVEAELGPPVCFICGRSFKSRRALMTHEYKYHGIRWVANKRIFPQQVKNVPNLKGTASKMKVEKNLDDYSNNSVNTGYNTSDESMKSTKNPDRAHSPVPILNPATCFELCPKCPSRYQNRRALTTHLVRIHKWKKNKLHAYFGQLKNLGSTLPKPVESSNEVHVSILDEDISNVDINEDSNELPNDDNRNITGNCSTKTEIHNGSNPIDNEFSNDSSAEKESADYLDDDFYDNSNECMYVTPNTDMFCLNGESLLEQNNSIADKNTCDTIKQSDFEAYQVIAKSDDVVTPTTENPIIDEIVPPVVSNANETDSNYSLPEKVDTN